MKRRLVWLLVGLLGLASAWIGVEYYLSQPDPMNESACQRIKPGMTLPEVEEVLGRSTNGTFGMGPGPMVDAAVPTARALYYYDYWEGEGGFVVVEFESQETHQDHFDFDTAKVTSARWVQKTPSGNRLSDLFHRLLSPLRLKLGL